MSTDICPKGMLPMEPTYAAEELDTFAELKDRAEAASDILNLPICWTINDDTVDGWQPAEGTLFTLVFLMPRKDGQTWGLSTRNFDRAEVQEWIDTFVRAEVMNWYGWQ